MALAGNRTVLSDASSEREVWLVEARYEQFLRWMDGRTDGCMHAYVYVYHGHVACGSASFWEKNEGR